MHQLDEPSQLSFGAYQIQLSLLQLFHQLSATIANISYYITISPTSDAENHFFKEKVGVFDIGPRRVMIRIHFHH